MTTRRQFRDTLMKNFGGARPVGGGEFQLFHADVVYMLAHCMDSIAMGFTSRTWPELYDVMKEADDVDGTKLETQVAAVHQVLAKFFKRIDTPQAMDEEVDTTVWETLKEAGWESLDARARIAWLSMLGLYHLSRVWVVGRQRHEMPSGGRRAVLEVVAQCSDQLLRLEDQHLSFHSDGTNALRAATKYALLCGLSEESIVTAVKHAAATVDMDVPVVGDDLSRVDVATRTHNLESSEHVGNQ